MKFIDRDALQWARYVSSKKTSAWAVASCMAIAVIFVAFAWIKEREDIAWVAFAFMFMAWLQFERRGFALLREAPRQPIEPRKDLSFGAVMVLLPTLALFVWLTIKSLTSR